MVKILISGSVGAGKTTAVRVVSIIKPASTEVPMSSKSTNPAKKTTTVGLDYGELVVGGGTRVSLFGTPGQRRYDFMCRILSKGAKGLLILIDHQSQNPLEDLKYYTTLFERLVPRSHTILAVTRSDGVPGFTLDLYRQALAEMNLQIEPVVLDARQPEDVKRVIEHLVERGESRKTESPMRN